MPIARLIATAAAGMTLAAPFTGDALSATYNIRHGSRVFIAAGCFQCHTLKAAGSKSPFGPDLDRLKPSYKRIVRQVIRGSHDMPAYDGVISRQAIRDVAAYVFASTHKKR